MPNDRSPVDTRASGPRGNGVHAKGERRRIVGIPASSSTVETYCDLLGGRLATSSGSDSESPLHRSERDALHEERRRVGRDLHDGTSQLLTLMQLKFAELRRSNEPDTAAIIEQCEDAIREIREQIR
jgi:signal transduction histidine kinase